MSDLDFGFKAAAWVTGVVVVLIIVAAFALGAWIF